MDYFWFLGSFVPLRNARQESILPAHEFSRFYMSLDLPAAHYGDGLRWLLHMPFCDLARSGQKNSVRREIVEDGGNGIVATYW